MLFPSGSHKSETSEFSRKLRQYAIYKESTEFDCKIPSCKSDSDIDGHWVTRDKGKDCKNNIMAKLSSLHFLLIWLEWVFWIAGGIYSALDNINMFIKRYGMCKHNNKNDNDNSDIN